MNPEFIQNLRYKLQRRTRKLRSAHPPLFHFLLLHFWGFVSGNPLIHSIVMELRELTPGSDQSAIRISHGEQLFGADEIEHAAIASGEAGKEILTPYPAEEMTAWPINTRVNSPRNNDADIINPF
jgi:hypothetical protein